MSIQLVLDQIQQILNSENRMEMICTIKKLNQKLYDDESKRFITHLKNNFPDFSNLAIEYLKFDICDGYLSVKFYCDNFYCRYKKSNDKIECIKVKTYNSNEISSYGDPIEESDLERYSEFEKTIIIRTLEICRSFFG